MAKDPDRQPLTALPGKDDWKFSKKSVLAKRRPIPTPLSISEINDDTAAHG